MRVIPCCFLIWYMSHWALYWCRRSSAYKHKHLESDIWVAARLNPHVQQHADLLQQQTQVSGMYGCVVMHLGTCNMSAVFQWFMSCVLLTTEQLTFIQDNVGWYMVLVCPADGFTVEWVCMGGFDICFFWPCVDLLRSYSNLPKSLVKVRGLWLYL